VEARHSMWSLSHDSLENDQLAPALSFLAKQLFAGTSVEVQLCLQDKSVAISPEVRREILGLRGKPANVLKHAKATKVHVGLSYKQQDCNYVCRMTAADFLELQVRAHMATTVGQYAPAY